MPLSTPSTFLQRWGVRLREHYSAPLSHIFKQFKLGAMTFFLGMVIVYSSLKSMPDSWQQELVLLTGLIAVGVGFLIAMLAQTRMLIARLIQFFTHP